MAMICAGNTLKMVDEHDPHDVHHAFFEAIC